MASSCVTPNFPYVPFQGRRIRGFDLLADYLWPEDAQTNLEHPNIPVESSATWETSLKAGHSDTASIGKAKTEFMIFLGDFVYADVPLYFGDDVESYRRLYRRNYQSDSFRRVYERLRR